MLKARICAYRKLKIISHWKWKYPIKLTKAIYKEYFGIQAHLICFLRKRSWCEDGSAIFQKFTWFVNESGDEDLSMLV